MSSDLDTVQETGEGSEGQLVPLGLGSSAFPGDNPVDRGSGLEGLGGTAHFASRTDDLVPHLWCTEHPGEQEDRRRETVDCFYSSASNRCVICSYVKSGE